MLWVKGVEQSWDLGLEQNLLQYLVLGVEMLWVKGLE